MWRGRLSRKWWGKAQRAVDGACYCKRMSDTALLDELLDPLTQCLDAESAQRVIAFGVAPEVQRKVSLLAERTNEGLASDAERAEYEVLVNAADFIAILKLKAQSRLHSQS